MTVVIDRWLRGLKRGGLGLLSVAAVYEQIGADIPWMTYEAEEMRTTGTVLGPAYKPHRVELESSGQRCVKLVGAGDYVEFTSTGEFDAMVLRYSLPDAPIGGGLSTRLGLFVNGERVRELPLSSRNAWLYGAYPFSNHPAQGKTRNFYDELRLKGLKIGKNDRVKLQKIAGDGVDCVVDLVDLERVPPPIKQPEGALSVLDFGAKGDGRSDDTEPLRAVVAEAQKTGGVVWVPAGDYAISGDIVVPSGVTIQGAGMWHTTFVGDATLYDRADRRVRFKLTGTDVHLADFAIFGQLNYRNDQEPNDGVVVAGAEDASVRRVWVEHTKAGVWVYNGVRLTIEGCRFRNLLADGVNLCVGTSHSVVENCSARGTGDDCFAIWPAPSDQGFDERAEKPGHNVIRRSTGQLTFLANGGAVYGGANNRIEDCLFTDIGTGCGILISTTFPTADETGKADNNFGGRTVVEDVRLIRCGGYDHSWAWRAALQICLDRRSIAGLRIGDVEIRDSLSDAISVVAPKEPHGGGVLSDTVLENVRVSGVGLGTAKGRELWIRADARGEMQVVGTPFSGVANESAEFRIVTRPQ